MEPSGSVLMTLHGDRHMHMFKLNPPASLGATWKTSFVIRKNENLDIDRTIGFTLIHDDIDQANMGYYLATHARKYCDCDSKYSYGGYIIHLNNAGTISWESHP